MNRKRNIWCFATVALGCFLATSTALSAAGLEKSIPDCPRWLANSDSFLEECKTHARSFTRTFYPGWAGGSGQKEQNSVWFSTASADSHFVMGCGLLFSGKPSFVGIYYTAVPSAIAQANTAPLMMVGFDGEAVIVVDGRPVRFEPVRPFATKAINTKWKSRPQNDLNCADPLEPDGAVHALASGPARVEFSRFDESHELTLSYRDSSRTSEYIEFFHKEGAPRDVIWHDGPYLIVGFSGDIYVHKGFFERACAEGIRERRAHSPILIHQLCEMFAK